ncbi:MAG TPA: SulP family inorganic anion transporter, partial [Acidimicrobiales bacterium]
MVEPHASEHAGRTTRWLPGVGVMRRYQVSWLRHDLTAGLVLTCLLVPAGMAYAEASGLSPVNGLYATFAALVAYFVVGPSRILVVGPDSSLTPVIAATIAPLAVAGGARATDLAAALAVLVGALMVGGALARVGFLTELLSKPVRYGYLNGIALTIVVSQLPKLCGFSTRTSDVVNGIRKFARGVADGKVNATALAIGVGSILVLALLRRLAPYVPGALVVVLGSIGLAVAFGLDTIPLVGDLPQGIPSPHLPDVRMGDWGRLLGGAVGVAVVAFADTSVLSRALAVRARSRVDPNHELAAVGMSNIAVGVFQGFPISSSATRTAVAEPAGARTQLTGLVGAGTVLLLLIAFPTAFRNLPSATLAAIMIVAALSLVEIKGMRRLAVQRRSEFLLSLVAFAGVAVLGVLPGIGLAVVLSLLNFVRKSWRPHTAELVRVSGLKGYHDVERHPDGRRVPGLLLYRFDAPLFFANAEEFRSGLMERIDDAPSPVRRVVVSAEPVTDVDATGAEALEELLDDLDARGIELAFAELKGTVRDHLVPYGIVDRLGPQ